MRTRWQLREGEKGGDKIGPSRAGVTSKRHVVVDGHGLPIGLHLEAGNVHDLKAAIPTLNSIRVPRRNGRPRTRPAGLAADTVFIAQTGWGQERDRQRTLEAGFNYHLTKPVNFNELSILLAKV